MSEQTLEGLRQSLETVESKLEILDEIKVKVQGIEERLRQVLDIVESLANCSDVVEIPSQSPDSSFVPVSSSHAPPSELFKSFQKSTVSQPYTTMLALWLAILVPILAWLYLPLRNQIQSPVPQFSRTASPVAAQGASSSTNTVQARTP